MLITESLQTGQFGLEMELPSRLRVCSENERYGELVDETGGVEWFFFYFPHHHLDLNVEHRADLRRSLEWYARYMFDDALRERDRLAGRLQPRSASPYWSPLVEVEHVEIAGAPALKTVHRTAYEHGREIVMGHLLVPLQRGLFEARVVAKDRITGDRETALLVEWMREEMATHPDKYAHASGEAGMVERLVATLQQQDFDDPRNDNVIPYHALSRARAAIRWFCDESNLHLTVPPAPLERGEVELPHLNCVFVPPPRFVYEPPTGPADEGSLSRVSFCGTDGVERLWVRRWDMPAGGPVTDLSGIVESLVQSRSGGGGHGGKRVHVEILPSLDERQQALVVVERTSPQPWRTAMRFLLDERGDPWSLSWSVPAVVPRDALAADLDAAARSFHLAHGPRERKSWWKGVPGDARRL